MLIQRKGRGGGGAETDTLTSTLTLIPFDVSPYKLNVLYVQSMPVYVLVEYYIIEYNRNWNQWSIIPSKVDINDEHILKIAHIAKVSI